MDCNVTGTGLVWLGRTWGAYSRVIFVRTYMENIILPEGWTDFGDPGVHQWVSTSNLAYSSEINCTTASVLMVISSLCKIYSWMHEGFRCCSCLLCFFVSWCDECRMLSHCLIRWWLSAEVPSMLNEEFSVHHWWTECVCIVLVVSCTWLSDEILLSAGLPSMHNTSAWDQERNRQGAFPGRMSLLTQMSINFYSLTSLRGPLGFTWLDSGTIGSFGETISFVMQYVGKLRIRYLELYKSLLIGLYNFIYW